MAVLDAPVRAKGKILSSDEEKSLFDQLDAARTSGNKRQADAVCAEIIEWFRPLLNKMVNRMSGYKMDRQELESEAMIGLVKAIRDFKPSNGNRFGVYATSCIRGTLYTYITRNYFLTNVCSNAKAKTLFFKMRRIMRDHINETGETRMTEVDIERMAGVHGVSTSMLRDMIGMASNPRESLDAKVMDGEDGSLTRKDLLVDESMSASEHYNIGQSQQIVRDLVSNALDKLDERSRDILYYQLLAPEDDRLTLGDLGDKYGITRERVRQIREIAHKKLRRTIAFEAFQNRIKVSDLFDD